MPQESPTAKIILSTDGGGDGKHRGAAAAIIVGLQNCAQHKFKFVAMLGGVNGNEAELGGAILGFALFAAAGQSSSEIIWETDSQYLLRTAAALRGESPDSNIANQGFWNVLRPLMPADNLSMKHVSAHSGHARNERCDSACRWIQQKGLLLLQTMGEGMIGRNAVIAPENAWVLVDWRDLVQSCQSGSETRDLVHRAISRLRELMSRG